MSRGAPMLTVRQAPALSEGDVGIEGIVEPHLSAENVAIRVHDYGGSFFQIRDSTGVIGVHFDPRDFRLPDVGASARVVGYKEIQSQDISVFFGTELVVGEVLE